MVGHGAVIADLQSFPSYPEAQAARDFVQGIALCLEGNSGLKGRYGGLVGGGEGVGGVVHQGARRGGGEQYIGVQPGIAPVRLQLKDKKCTVAPMAGNQLVHMASVGDLRFTGIIQAI